MLTKTPAEDRVVPADIYRRASVQDFVNLVNDQIPTLELSEDRAIAIAYALAWHEEQGTGSIVRHLGALWRFDPDDLEALLAAGYATLFPTLAPETDG